MKDDVIEALNALESIFVEFAKATWDGGFAEHKYADYQMRRIAASFDVIRKALYNTRNGEK